MKDQVIEFISRRFQNDCRWLDGNCYYFAIILQNRFSQGNIYYDVVAGHFIFELDDHFYDFTGLINQNKDNIVSWDKFDDYDCYQRARIIKNCIL